MKIAVCGKGGSGKSTFTALLAKEFAVRGKKVLVIDSDESNYGLHLQRGTDNAADIIAMVVDPSMESLKLSGRVAEMSRSIGKKPCFVLNKVTPEFEELMKETVSPNGEILAVLSADGAIQKAGIMGQELSVGSPQIREAADRLLAGKGDFS